VFLTTHFMDEAQFLADRVAIIAAGRIVATGTPDQLIGSGAAPTRIRFRLRDGVAPPDGVDAQRVGPAWQIETGTPTSVLHTLTTWALGAGTELLDLEVTRASLEDVYLQLTAEAGADRAAP
jgi:ABC-2 type transport system ATP-binding protein